MNESRWAETQTELRKLETLLPQLETLSASTDQRRSSILTSGLDAKALAKGAFRWLQMMIRRGWRLSDDHRNLTKGEGKYRQETPADAGFIGPWPMPWDVKHYNPRLHTPAALMGATWVGPNRYRLGSLLVDANGCARNEQDECPVCGALPGDTYRVVRIEHSNPHAEPWKQRFAPCPRCSGPEHHPPL